MSEFLQTDIKGEFDNLNHAGKQFVIYFINKVPFKKIVQLQKENTEFIFELDLIACQLDYLDVKHLVNNHLSFMKENTLTMPLLVSSIEPIDRRVYSPKENFIVHAKIPNDTLYFFKLFMREMGMTNF